MTVYQNYINLELEDDWFVIIPSKYSVGDI